MTQAKQNAFIPKSGMTRKWRLETQGKPSHSDPGMSAASILREFGASPSQNYDVHKDRPGPPNDMVVTCGNRYAMTTMVW
jgi:hypothetical protein